MHTMTPPASDADNSTQWRRITKAMWGKQVQRVFQSSPSIFTVNSLLFFHPAVPSHLQSAWFPPPHTVFLSHWVFCRLTPPPPCGLYPNWVFMPSSCSPAFSRFFLRKKPAAFGAEPSPPNLLRKYICSYSHS